MRAAIVLLSLLLVAPAVAQQRAKQPQRPAPAPPPLCEAPEPVPKDITAEPFYRDPKKSIVDAVAAAKNNTTLAPLDKPLRKIVNWSNLWVAKQDKAALTCALSWMAGAAADEAMLGAMSSEQAEHERRWRTAGMAVVWLKLKPQATVDQQAGIERWLKALAEKNRADDARRRVGNHIRNWSALGATAVGFATGDAALQGYGRAGFDAALKEITPEGRLPAEIGRGQLALHYHHYALAPLVLSAEIAARHGQDWYAGAEPLHRLANFTAAAMVEPEPLVTLAGTRQKPVTAGFVGWQAFYGRRFPDRLKQGKQAGPWGYSWLGGNLSDLSTLWIK